METKYIKHELRCWKYAYSKQSKTRLNWYWTRTSIPFNIEEERKYIKNNRAEYQLSPNIEKMIDTILYSILKVNRSLLGSEVEKFLQVYSALYYFFPINPYKNEQTLKK